MAEGKPSRVVDVAVGFALVGRECPLCGVVFAEGDKALAIMNNRERFPNIFVHQGCWCEGAEARLGASWEAAKPYAAWFGQAQQV